MTGEPWWMEHAGADLAQGDFLSKCVVPLLPAGFKPPTGDVRQAYDVEAVVYDLIIITQTCDLHNNKAPLVACCPIFEIGTYETLLPDFKVRGRWEEVRLGRREGLHMLAAIKETDDNRKSLVVDFRQIYSLPIGYLSNLAKELPSRVRLRSPYVEHFSQGFARFFMRVGLPAGIPPFK